MSEVIRASRHVLEPWIHHWQTDSFILTSEDVDGIFEAVSNTSVRFQVRPQSIEMLENSSSTILDRARANFFKQVFQDLHQSRGLPVGLDFVMNLHDEPLILNSFQSFVQPPIFSFCPGIGFADIPMANDNIVKLSTSLAAETRESSKWSSRVDTAFWRGSTTGGWYTLSNWRTFPRTTLTQISKNFPDIVNASFVKCAQCDKGVWEAIQAEGLTQREEYYPDASDLRRHKYLVDIDGNACSFRFIGLLGHGAVVFKVQPNYTEFFDPFLIPFIHFVPIKSDMSDLIEKLEWARQHDSEMEKIAAAALQSYEVLIKNGLWKDWVYHTLSMYHMMFTENHWVAHRRTFPRRHLF